MTKKEKLLPEGLMITNSRGISYYQHGNKYYSNNGWVESEITYERFRNEVNKAKAQIEVTLTLKKNS